MGRKDVGIIESAEKKLCPVGGGSSVPGEPSVRVYRVPSPLKRRSVVVGSREICKNIYNEFMMDGYNRYNFSRQPPIVISLFIARVTLTVSSFSFSHTLLKVRISKI